jgi:hypothetical protein
VGRPPPFPGACFVMGSTQALHLPQLAPLIWPIKDKVWAVLEDMYKERLLSKLQAPTGDALDALDVALSVSQRAAQESQQLQVGGAGGDAPLMHMPLSALGPFGRPGCLCCSCWGLGGPAL